MTETNETPRIGLKNLLRRSEVISRLGISKSVFSLIVKSGDFPKPVKMSPHVHYWPESDIDDFVARKIKERDNA